jgi:hypothetical protein
MSRDWHFDKDDYDFLIDTLSGLSTFRMEERRWAFIDAILTDSPRAADIKAQLSLKDPPRHAAINTVTLFKQFGQDMRGRPLLGVLINRIIDGGYITDPDVIDRLRAIIRRYELGQTVLPSHPLDRWQGHDNLQTVQEKIIGENTLRDIAMLEEALAAAQAVVRVVTPNGMGTGFLVTPSLLMTNHHVIPSPEVARQCSIDFHYQRARDGNPRQHQTCGVKVDGAFHSHSTLDYTVVELDHPPDVQPLTLRGVRLEPDTRVSIIQHPNGYYKQISMQNNFVAYADADVVQYITSTLPGSSGSPVFNDAFEVVAIHHSGGEMPEPSTGRRYLRNAGTPMLAVLRDLREQQPQIADNLTE